MKEMTSIAKCNMSVCMYNQKGMCHTPGITVGPHAECNTYNYAKSKGGFDEVSGAIGACAAADCKFNEQFECRAPNIDVSSHSVHADCKTFSPRI